MKPEELRRIAVRAQALDGSATSILDAIRRMPRLQLDPTARVAPTHLLVLWSRLGAYDRAELDRLLWEEKALFEWQAFIRPMDDLPLIRSLMRRYPDGDFARAKLVRQWLEANAAFGATSSPSCESAGRCFPASSKTAPPSHGPTPAGT